MADTPAQAAAKFQKLADRMSGRDVGIISRRVAQKVKPIASAAVSPDTLSHWGRGGRRGSYVVKARYTIEPESRVNLYPTIPPLAALLEKGSGTVWKAPRRRGQKRRKKGSIGTYTRAAVPPRRAWSKVAAAIEPVAPRVVDEEVRRILGEIF